jgi:anti-anti-sigma regulatory factor
VRIPSIDSGPPKLDDAGSDPLRGGEAATGAGRLIPTRDFALAVERVENGTLVLVLAGELDLYRAPEIEQALAEAIEPERDRHGRESTNGAVSTNEGESGYEDAATLAVDLRSVTFLDSTALKILLAASRRQRARGGELLVLVGPDTPTKAFEVTGFDRLLAMKRVDPDPSAAAA